MKKHLIALAMIAALLAAACSAKDSARLDMAIAVAEGVVALTAPPVADDPQAPSK